MLAEQLDVAVDLVESLYDSLVAEDCAIAGGLASQDRHAPFVGDVIYYCI